MNTFYAKNKKIIWIGLAVALAGGAYWYWNKKKKEKESTAPEKSISGGITSIKTGLSGIKNAILKPV
jgi:LPXTG-motif cell wall-anchored protein